MYTHKFWHQDLWEAQFLNSYIILQVELRYYCLFSYSTNFFYVMFSLKILDSLNKVVLISYPFF